MKMSTNEILERVHAAIVARVAEKCRVEGSGAQQDSFGLDAEAFRQFFTFAHEFEADICDLAAFLFDEHPDISNFISHSNHPNVWSAMSSWIRPATPSAVGSTFL